MRNDYLVSCIIPSYKRCDTVRRSIESVLSQTYNNVEVLVVDDNEKGDTYSAALHSLLNEFAADSRVKLITQEKHINGAEARNAGIRASCGELIAFLDDDDVWCPTKLEKQVKELELHPDCNGVSCLYSHYNQHEEVVRSCPPYTGDNLHYKIINRDVAVFTSTVLLKKENLFDSGLFDNKLRRHQDLQLLLDFTRKNKIYVLQEYLVKLYIDSNLNRAKSAFDVIKIKEDFFNTCNEHLLCYEETQRKDILAAHYFEIVFSAVKSKDIKNICKYLIKIGINPSAYLNLYRRSKQRKLKVNIY